MEALIMQLLGGAVGGNVAGGLLKKLSLGILGNSIVGILGGGLGGQLLQGVLGAQSGSAFDVANIAKNILSSGAGGGILMVIAGLIKKYLFKK